MPHLLNVWPSVQRQLSRASHILLLLDYDGTLSPVAAHPDLAILPPRTRDSLITLYQNPAFSLGIVSGRELEDVAAKVPLPDLIYAGNHGLEIRGPNLAFIHPEAQAIKPAIEILLNELDRSLSGYEGILVEGKGLTLSVHYRLTPEELRPQVFAGFDRVLTDAGQEEKVRVTKGKELLEVRPRVDWNKGKAIARIASDFPQGTLVMFFGDDQTDEDGFTAVHELNGISVFVGPARQPTRALYRVDSPAEVAQTLELMALL